jgi:hypothetical protein
MRETGRYPISSPFDRIAIPQLANYRATRFHACAVEDAIDHDHQHCRCNIQQANSVNRCLFGGPPSWSNFMHCNIKNSALFQTY